MPKRKRETADEQLASPERHRDAKKQRTNTTASKSVSKHSEIGGSAQAQAERNREKKLARKLAKREKKAQKIQQRNGLRPKDGVRKAEDNGDIRMVGVQEKRLPKKGRAQSSTKNGLGKQELGNKDGPLSREKRKEKKEKRKEKNEQSDGKKNKEEAVEIETWKISDPLEGQMLDLDPIFSPDEK